MRVPRRPTLRTFVSSALAASAWAAEHKPEVFPADWKRYPDPTTELDVYRLTDPAYSSFLTAHYARGLARRSGSLLYSSTRAGSLQAFRMDLKSGETRKLTDVEDLDSQSLN